MGVHKLNLDSDFLDDENYVLIGIHTTLEDFRLAFLLNKMLNLKLMRHKLDLELGNTSKFALFEWIDENNLMTWNLVANACTQDIEAPKVPVDLFSNTYSKTYYVLPEYKKVNYILKISDSCIYETDDVLKQIKNINRIIAAYTIDTKHLKSKTNLIFY